MQLREAPQLPNEPALFRVGEVEMVFHCECAICFACDLHRRPDFPYGIKAAFALTIRTDNTVRCLVARDNYFAGVRTFDTIVSQRPYESAAQVLAGAHEFPVVLHARARATVKKAML